MCLLIALRGLRSEAPLVMAANRDELFARPALSMTVLRPQGPRILGGRDLLLQGTWLSVNEHGVIAALTNATGGAARDPHLRSRGELPLLLTRHETAEAAAAELVARVDPARYNACWIFVGDRERLYYIGLQPGQPLRAEPLSPGIHVLENHPLSPDSIKATFIRGQAQRALAGAAPLQTALHGILRSHELPPAVQDLPSSLRPPATYAACVHGAGHGTRTAAIIELPAARTERPRIVYSDGPPCTAPLQSTDGLWSD